MTKKKLKTMCGVEENGSESIFVVLDDSDVDVVQVSNVERGESLEDGLASVKVHWSAACALVDNGGRDHLSLVMKVNLVTAIGRGVLGNGDDHRVVVRGATTAGWVLHLTTVVVGEFTVGVNLVSLLQGIFTCVTRLVMHAADLAHAQRRVGYRGCERRGEGERGERQSELHGESESEKRKKRKVVGGLLGTCWRGEVGVRSVGGRVEGQGEGEELESDEGKGKGKRGWWLVVDMRT